ncbi:UNVERIFIED_CONTAM: Nucleolar protein 12, partial [Siphonaria sp. JEL0065]
DKASVEKALALNGHIFEGKHIRVDKAQKSEVNDTKQSIFLGNLSFDVAEEAIWEFFKDCGDIKNVRVVRDKKTNIGKGFGYVQFAEKQGVEVALKMDGKKLAGRDVRVTKCSKSQILRRHAGKTAGKKDAKKDDKKNVVFKRKPTGTKPAAVAKPVVAKPTTAKLASKDSFAAPKKSVAKK